MNAPAPTPALAPAKSRAPDFIALRHALHADPELAFAETATSARIAGLLSGWGYRVRRLAGTGLVASLDNGPGPALAIRADMDALPIHEATGLSFASRNPGVMHACGHDGHSAILLAAAWELARRRDLRGRLELIFQPAEEIGAGARAMLAEGLLDAHPVDAVFALHNWPGAPAGRFGLVEGPAMAAIDRLDVVIAGQGGHGAEPHLAVDPVLAASHAVTALQSLVSRNTDPREMAVVTVASIHGGEAANVIPGEVALKLSLRSYRDEVRQTLRSRAPEILRAIAAAFGATARVTPGAGIPSVINSPAETRLLRQVALDRFGADAVIADFAPRTASEDFAYFLRRCPGSFVFVGNGDGPPLHSPDYRFNDAIIAPAAALWVALAARFLTGESHA
ncbi:MAG: amidohydrolase [Paracoccus aminovorans]|nr:amidohydrolase [Paracoccus aminovorans]